MPDAFEDALDYLQQSLSTMAQQGSHVCASRASLEALVQAARAAASADRSPAPETAAVSALKTEPASAAVEAPARLTPSPAQRQPVAVPTPAPVAKPEPPSKLKAPDDARPKSEQLADLYSRVAGCDLCTNLAGSRTQVVFGVGNPDAELMFVGEAPGEDEDLQGEPFVGKAGQLLTKIIETMGLSRDSVYIANILKCRPDMPAGASGNRKPNSAEMGTCLPYLERQIAIIQPKVLVALGATAMEGLLGETSPMARLRGRWHDFRGIPLMATYHPAYLLRNQSLSEKRKVWEDMLLVLEKLGLSISDKQRGYFLNK